MLLLLRPLQLLLRLRPLLRRRRLLPLQPLRRRGWVRLLPVQLRLLRLLQASRRGRLPEGPQRRLRLLPRLLRRLLRLRVRSTSRGCSTPRGLGLRGRAFLRPRTRLDLLVVLLGGGQLHHGRLLEGLGRKERPDLPGVPGSKERAVVRVVTQQPALRAQPDAALLHLREAHKGASGQSDPWQPHLRCHSDIGGLEAADDLAQGVVRAVEHQHERRDYHERMAAGGVIVLGCACGHAHGPLLYSHGSTGSTWRCRLGGAGRR
mmetsp:Transcript_81473/g.256914  ORF Transcript_81473/g.256914 Transcript_81473/m.256914 type:complete len:262 (+) Transcript_81473:1349-2134(+)